MVSYFDKGRAHYEQQEYEEAVKCFAYGSEEQLCNSCRIWLGQCCEYGLGTAKDLTIAKDLYNIALLQLGIRRRDYGQGLWLQERIKCLSNIPKQINATGS